ncbi:hypothetical protein [Streptomyces niveus]|uniref:hypothetical protein n=1 Tax=Streptomyces niveus TaxID=193462 RepID=UPI003870174D
MSTQGTDAKPESTVRLEFLMDRSDDFRAAHALVSGLEWEGDEKFSVYDVLQVAKFLGGEDG